MKTTIRLMAAASLLVASICGASGKIQNEDVKSVSDVQSSALITTGNLTISNNCLSGLASVTNLGAGQYVYDTTNPTAIAAATTITAVGACSGANSVTMSSTAVSSHTGDTVTFGGTASQVVNASKIYVIGDGIDNTLQYAIDNNLIGGGGGSGANTALSNLSSVAINTAPLPGSDNAIALGSSSKRWTNIHLLDMTLYGSTSGNVQIKAADTTSLYAFKLPASQGSANTYLKNDGAGNTTWSTVAGGVRDLAAQLFFDMKQESSVISGSDARKIIYAPSLKLYAVASDSGSSTDITTSPDGFNWTGRAASGPFFDITWSTSLSLFVAVGNSGIIKSSPDGITWTSHTDPNSGATYHGVIYSTTASKFVAVSSDGKVATSPDGLTWTAQTPSAANAWYALADNGTVIVAVGQTSGAANQVMTSPDGVTWTARTASSNRQWASVTFGNSLFVASSIDGTANAIMTSPDGTTWTTRTTDGGGSPAWNQVIYMPELGMFGGVSASGGSTQYLTSFDGVNWFVKFSINNLGINSIVWEPVTGQITGVFGTAAFLSNTLGTGW